MDSSTARLKRRRLQTGAVAIIALCAQYTTLLMATTPTATSSAKAYWNDKEIAAFIDYLHDHKAEAGDGGNFKISTFNRAAEHLAPLLTQGGKKTSAMCKTKWASASQYLILFLARADIMALSSSKPFMLQSIPIKINLVSTGTMFMVLILKAKLLKLFGHRICKQRFLSLLNIICKP